MGESSARFSVKLTDISPDPNKHETRAVMSMSFNGIFPHSDILHPILRKIDELYAEMLTKMREDKDSKTRVKAHINKFLEETSQHTIIGEGLIKNLAEDAGIDMKTLVEILIETNYVNSVVEYIAKEYWRNKSAPVKYAESYHQLVDLFGIKGTFNLLKMRKVELKNVDVIYDFYHFSKMHPQVKEMVRNRELAYSTALLFSSLDPAKQLEFATKARGMSYNQVRKMYGLKGTVISVNDMKRLGLEY